MGCGGSSEDGMLPGQRCGSSKHYIVGCWVEAQQALGGWGGTQLEAMADSRSPPPLSRQTAPAAPWQARTVGLPGTLQLEHKVEKTARLP